MRYTFIENLGVGVVPQDDSARAKTYKRCTIACVVIIIVLMLANVILLYTVYGDRGSLTCSPPIRADVSTLLNDTEHGKKYETTSVYNVTEFSATVNNATTPGSSHIGNSATTSGMDWEKQKIEQELKELREVGCQPTQQVMHLSTLLTPDDNLADKRTLKPEWVVVRRCLSTFSYCPGPRRCRPAPGTERNKTIVVYAQDEDGSFGYHQRKVVEHTSCSCQ
ncbi:uncharacterized protein LOC121874671 isoform X1 [Homarus americanus]|uniref:uncharacterized protein LOC121874670 isoform X1 n=1 Tax=Homarus americanus TaxID=6706 RepID=UPI001C4483A8|nr:uncharacterized protein LOC121874670 isoform X1 [Homarus americanus]XP_042234836.1 uncharacterized protein LOC121874671 isoform X1 [Homarus americanus]